MKIKGIHLETIMLSENGLNIQIIDQRHLPFKLLLTNIHTADEMYLAIKDMAVRGAPLIGAAAAWGLYLSALNAPFNDVFSFIQQKANLLRSSRPTAVNLFYAIDRVLKRIPINADKFKIIEIIKKEAIAIQNDERYNSIAIGKNGLEIIRAISKNKNGKTVNILTHCNAGWLACIDYGTATAPMYLANNDNIPIHVWVDETRPRNQGSRLTAFELENENIPHTIIADNTGGHLMQHGLVDLVIVGCDRMTANGDAANKIGTYLKALAAFDNKLPFYVALPFSSIDFNIVDGIQNIPIELRDKNEVLYTDVWYENRLISASSSNTTSPAANYAFDVTPARLITAVITEKGVFKPNELINSI